MSELEVDYQKLQEEVGEKIAAAVKLLEEASTLANRAKAWELLKFPWEGLRDAVGNFVELADDGWTCSMW